MSGLSLFGEALQRVNHGALGFSPLHVGALFVWPNCTQRRGIGARFQSPSCRGSLCLLYNGNDPTSYGPFQSPSCRGSLCLHSGYIACYDFVPFQSPSCRGSLCLVIRFPCSPRRPFVSVPFMSGLSLFATDARVRRSVADVFQSPSCRGSLCLDQAICFCWR